MMGKTVVAIFHALSLLLQPEKDELKIKNFIYRFVDSVFWVTLYFKINMTSSVCYSCARENLL